jgi:hypothetical protein
MASAAEGGSGRGGEGGGRGAGGGGRGGGGRGAGGGGRGGWSRGTDGGGESTPDRKTVWVLRDGKPAPIFFKAGVTDGTVTEIAEGQLREGDQVITAVTGGAEDSRNQQMGGGAFRRVF